MLSFPFNLQLPSCPPSARTPRLRRVIFGGAEHPTQFTHFVTWPCIIVEEDQEQEEQVQSPKQGVAQEQEQGQQHAGEGQPGASSSSSRGKSRRRRRYWGLLRQVFLQPPRGSHALADLHASQWAQRDLLAVRYTPALLTTVEADTGGWDEVQVGC